MKPTLGLKGRKSIPAAPVGALRLCWIAVDKRTMIHGMAQASHLVLQNEFFAAVIWIDELFEAELMIAHLFGNQAAALQVSIGRRKVGDVNRDMVPIIGRDRLFGLSEEQKLMP